MFLKANCVPIVKKNNNSCKNSFFQAAYNSNKHVLPLKFDKSAHATDKMSWNFYTPTAQAPAPAAPAGARKIKNAQSALPDAV